MPHPRRRAPRHPLRRSAYVVLVIASASVVGALVSGSAVLVGVSAVVAVVLAIGAVACVVEESLDGRRAAAAANASLAATYTRLFDSQATEHQHELERLVAQVAALAGRVSELTERNLELADRNADLELAAALSTAGRPLAPTPDASSEEQRARSTVVNLPVQQFDHTPVQHARASGH
jgi:hypothetical protein